MIDSQVIAFTLVAAALTLSPGADTMLVLRNVLRGGRRDGVVTTFGICSGLFIHATLSALGVSMILMYSARAFQVVKITGACYIVWLGLQSLWSAVHRHPNSLSWFGSKVGYNVSSSKSFFEGLLTNLLNPKVAVFYLAFLPQFIGSTDPVLPKSLFLASIHYALGIIWLVSLSTVLDRTRGLLVKAKVRRWLNGVCGTVLIGLGLRLALQKR